MSVLTYQYSKTSGVSLGGPQTTHDHKLIYSSIDGDYSATVEVVVPLDASVTSTYSVINNISYMNYTQTKYLCVSGILSSLFFNVS
jgi:hypothetical protein